MEAFRGSKVIKKELLSVLLTRMRWNPQVKPGVFVSIVIR
jgi:hypothetical protein